MNIYQLEAIIMIVEKGSFRAAAAALNRSQSALSAMVKNFETEFDITVFDRSKYRPTLTPAGSAFLAVAQSTFDATQYACRVAKELGAKKTEATLKVLVDPLASKSYLKTLVKECAKPILPVNLVVSYSISKDDHSAIFSGEIDLAIAHCSERIRNIERLPLERLKIVGAVPKALIPKNGAITEQLLAKTTQIITYDKAYDEAPDEFIPERAYRGGGPKIFVSDHFSKVKLIENGFGWGRISETECRSNRKLVPVGEDILPGSTLNLCLLRASKRALGPVARSIWKAFEG